MNLKKILKAAVLPIFATALIVSCGETKEEIVANEIQQIMETNKAVSLAVVAVKDGQVVYNNTFGYKDLEIQENCNKIIQDFKLKEIIVTCGAKGSYVASAEGTFNFEPTPKIKVADTVGAGDSFTAAYCSATLAGKNCIEAHKLAVEVSSYVCTCNGAIPKLPKHLIEKIR